MFFYDLERLEKEQNKLTEEEIKQIIINIDSCDYRVEFKLSKSGKTVNIVAVNNDNFEYFCKCNYVVRRKSTDEYIFPHQTIKGKVLRNLILDNYI